MEVILLERVEKLGALGEIVSVKPGYARNFLLPSGKALRSNKANLARFEAERAGIEKLNDEKKAEAKTFGDTLDGHSFVVIRSASDVGNLYGSVSPRDVADSLAEDGFKVDRNQIALEKAIKELGLHEIRIILHPEVSVSVTANVARSEDEAVLQAEGKSIAELRAEEEAAEAAEFDVRSLFDEDADLREDLSTRSKDDDAGDNAEESDDDVAEKPARGKKDLRDTGDEEYADAD